MCQYCHRKDCIGECLQNIYLNDPSSPPPPPSNPSSNSPRVDEARRPLIQEVLAERSSRYGNFRDQAIISQKLKYVMEQHGLRTGKLNSHQVEALEIIAHKIARILNGDPNYADSWVDIAGYAQLVVDRL